MKGRIRNFLGDVLGVIAVFTLPWILWIIHP